MEKQKYYIGLDIGTDSVGYAVTKEDYSLCKHGGEPMWGVTLFEEASLSNERRSYRTARRRLARRKQRVHLLSEIFAPEVGKVDPEFFTRIKGSYLYHETPQDTVRLFGSYEAQRDYCKKYPTIHHLICKLMEDHGPHDIRLVYIACAWLLAHRGHFLKDVDKTNIQQVLDFKEVYHAFTEFLLQSNAVLPWDAEKAEAVFECCLRAKLGITAKAKALKEQLMGKKKLPKDIDEDNPYRWEDILKLLCGGKVALSSLFGKEEYDLLEEKSVALSMDDEKLAVILSSLEDDGELILLLKQIYDWSVLVDILAGTTSISASKVAVYHQHAKDLKFLKAMIRKYLPNKYHEVFRSEKAAHNYVAYSRYVKNCKHPKSVKHTKKEDFSAYLSKLLKGVTPDATDAESWKDMLSRLELKTFLPKQVDSDNRVIPYQLYWHELHCILKKAQNYLQFLTQPDAEGYTPTEKILSIMEFRIPYFVGPLKTNPANDRKKHFWMVRREEGRIRPWNFDRKVDLDASEEAFISRMTNTCTYIPGEGVLPKNSLVYSSFCVLNEINNLKVNGYPIDVPTKQRIYQDLFMGRSRVTFTAIKKFLISNNIMGEKDSLSGIDESVHSSLSSYLRFSSLLGRKLLSYSDIETIITRATYAEEKHRFSKWLANAFPHLSKEDRQYIAGLRFKDFGRMSRAFLCQLQGVDKATGEVFSVMEALWNTNCNLMELLSDRFTFAQELEKITKDYYADHPTDLRTRLDEMYVSNTVKRQIFRTLDILKDVIKIRGQTPTRIFVEMARGASEEQKGKRTKTRLQQLRELYEKVDTEDVRILTQQLEDMGESVHNKLQSDKLFLYFIQLGKCLYTGKPINLQSVLSGDGAYNIEHIYPRSFVKDDSILNNKILVDSRVNGEKSDIYPIPGEIRRTMADYWNYLHKIGCITDEKLKRLTRKTGFTENEKYEFINRQLVETRQSTKVIATLLKEFYPDTEVVYVKAGLVSEFRQAFDLLKSRQVNDLHHAKDAYLNIVVGNVWHCKFSRQFYRKEQTHNIKPEALFTHPVNCQNTCVWNGSEDLGRVKTITRKNTARVTRFSFCRKGGLFDQMPLSAAEGLVPRKKNMPTEIYGGYNKTTASFFVLVRYHAEKKSDIMVMPVELMHAQTFRTDKAFAVEYSKQTISNIIHKPVDHVEFLLNGRPLKINTMLSLDGFRVCITGKSKGGANLGVSVASVFMTSMLHEHYIKKLESLLRKQQTNEHIRWSEVHDGISSEKNLLLYNHYIDKLQKWPYAKRPANPVKTLIEGKDTFSELTPPKQAEVLMQIQGLFGRAIKANLKLIGGVESAGVTTLSSKISNWANTYQDVRIIDSSTSGLYEIQSCNLLELL